MPRVLVPTRATSLLPLAIIVFLTFSISAGLSVAALSSRYWVKEVNPIFSSVATTGLFESCISFQDGSISSCHPFPDERVCSRAKHDDVETLVCTYWGLARYSAISGSAVAALSWVTMVLSFPFEHLRSRLGLPGGMIALHALFQTLTLALISYVVSQGALSTWSGVVSYDWAFHLALASLVVDVFLLGVQIAGSVVVWYERREYTAIAG